MTDTITMSFDEWVEEFKPVQNHIDDNASIDGLMFETYGKELEFVRAQDITTYGHLSKVTGSSASRKACIS